MNMMDKQSILVVEIFMILVVLPGLSANEDYTITILPENDLQLIELDFTSFAVNQFKTVMRMG